MDIRQLKAFAARQWDDYRKKRPGSAFIEPGVSLTLEEAYQIQMEVADLRRASGDTIVGYKVGCIGPGVVEQFGMSGPIHARLFGNEVHSSGETLRHSAFANPAIEGEMAVRLGPGGRIAAAFPVIELHHFVFRRPQKTLAELVANNGINAGVVIPRHLERQSLADWTGARELSVMINGRTVDKGALWAMKGGASEAVEWLSTDLQRFGRKLMPGDVVLAGTPLGLHPVNAGDHVVVSIDGHRSVDCRFR